MPARDSSREAHIVAMRRSGMTLAQIANEFDITREWVRQLLLQAGEPPRGSTDITPAIAAYRSGESLSQAAEKVGLTGSGLWSALKRAGIARRRPGPRRKVNPLHC